MSSYVFMKFLESSPARYDLGISIITLGKLKSAYAEVVKNIRKGEKVLDVGCGTGILSLMAARKGARVDAIDINAEMLNIARIKAQKEELDAFVDFKENSILELEISDAIYDHVISGLCFSELSRDEIIYSLDLIHKVLKAEGEIVIADEARPNALWKRFILFILRVPFVILTYLVAQTTTHPIPKDLQTLLSEKGFSVEEEKRYNLDGFVVLRAVKI